MPTAVGKVFIDTNVLLYLLSADGAKADRAEQVVLEGGVISIQVLNEFASVALRKLRMTIAEIREFLEPIQAVLRVEPLTLETHVLGLQLAERYGLSIYDALIVAAAHIAGCGTLYSEDMQDGQRMSGLILRNPFASGSSR